MRRVLNDPQLQAQFDRDGYVRVPFLKPEEVTYLYNKCQSYSPTDKFQPLGEYFTSHVSLLDPDQEYRKAVFNDVTTVFKPYVDKYLAQYSPLIANFIVKQPGKGAFTVHQNWAFVNENHYTSVSIWCPLVDSTLENGTLHVLPGSHKKFSHVRCPSIPCIMESQHELLRKEYLIPLETKAGDCVILDDSIIHYSSPNLSKNLRIAIQLILKPEEAPAIHFYADPNRPGKVEVYEASAEFFQRIKIGHRPEGIPLLGEIDYIQHPLTEAELQHILEINRANSFALAA
jgi:hypothetical protein